VLSQWEFVEVELSHIYAIFCGKYFLAEAYDDYYQEGRTTKNRIKRIENAAERYFQRFPSQALEGQFSQLTRKIGGFADRRHEVAHGVVRPIQWFRTAVPQITTSPEAPFEYCLAPPHYQRGWIDENQRPLYIYTSTELKRIEEGLVLLLQEVVLFKNRIPR
jgi:hypothetical protein